MFQIYSELTSSGDAYSSYPAQINLPSVKDDSSEQMQEKYRGKCSVYLWSLPLRYSSLSIRRKLIRMMLTLHKYGEAGGDLSSNERGSFMPAEDYARAVIDRAMLRGELRCCSSEQMSHYFLSLTVELLNLMTGIKKKNASLRKEVRCRTADFLNWYAAGTSV